MPVFVSDSEVQAWATTVLSSSGDTRGVLRVKECHWHACSSFPNHSEKSVHTRVKRESGSRGSEMEAVAVAGTRGLSAPFSQPLCESGITSEAESYKNTLNVE